MVVDARIFFTADSIFGARFIRVWKTVFTIPFFSGSFATLSLALKSAFHSAHINNGH